MTDLPSDRPLSVLVVGGGIAGLTTAVALRRAGHEVEVVELQPSWAVTGWGLSLTGPALRALSKVGLDEQCLAAGYGISAITNCGVDGRVLNSIELPSLLGPGQPAQVGMGRPALSAILREAAIDHGARLRTDLTVRLIDEESEAVRAELSDGSTRRVDVLVGADGVNSRVRKLLGIADKPFFTDQWVWRVSVERPRWADSLYTFTAPNHSSGLIPIADDQAYIFCTECTSRTDRPSARDVIDGVRKLLSPLSGRMQSVIAGIKDPQRVVSRPVMSLYVEENWFTKRCVLIGDAVHTGGPQMVSGAALAIEDGVLLAEYLSNYSDLELALNSFQIRRQERTRLVVKTTLEIGQLEHDHRYAEVHALQRTCHAAMAEAI